MHLEAEDCRQPQKLKEARKDLRAFREHGSAAILSLNQNCEAVNVLLSSSIVCSDLLEQLQESNLSPFSLLCLCFVPLTDPHIPLLLYRVRWCTITQIVSFFIPYLHLWPGWAMEVSVMRELWLSQESLASKFSGESVLFISLNKKLTEKSV